VLRAVNIIELITVADWRPRILHAVEFLFEHARLAVYNAMDENGLTDVPEDELPVTNWRRVHVA
jgi:cytochrome c5